MKYFVIAAVLVAAASAQNYLRVQDDPDRSKCNWQGTAEGYRLLTFAGNLVDEDNIRLSQDWKRYSPSYRHRAVYWRRHDNSMPPENWDGSFDSLPFPKPKKDSDLYKFLLCWPLIPSNADTSTELSIFEDEDGWQCQWISDVESHIKNGVEVYYWYPKKNLKVGFPSEFRASEISSSKVEANQTEIESPVGYPRPPQNWDGRPSTLGFPMPAKDTPEYNMLLCWPFDVTFTKK